MTPHFINALTSQYRFCIDAQEAYSTASVCHAISHICLTEYLCSTAGPHSTLIRLVVSVRMIQHQHLRQRASAPKKPIRISSGLHIRMPISMPIGMPVGMPVGMPIGLPIGSAPIGRAPISS